MNEIVSFSKEIEFNTPINKISSISLEHTLCLDNDSSIKGDLIVTGTYKQNEESLIDSPFSYKIPIDIVLDEKYDLSNMTIDIDNFTYEVVDNNKIKVNIDILLDKLELKKKEDDLIDLDDLFLEKEEEKELVIPTVDTAPPVEEIIEVKQDDKKEKNDESLFSNLDSTNDTYSTYSIYIMKENDSIEEIMAKYRVTKNQLDDYNDLTDIKIGTKLIIPNSNE